MLSMNTSQITSITTIHVEMILVLHFVSVVAVQ